MQCPVSGRQSGFRQRVSTPSELARSSKRPRCNRRAQQRSSHCRASVEQPLGDESSSEPLDESIPLQGDWRDFRARLLTADAQACSTSGIRSKENMQLLEKQNPFLAKEPVWARATSAPQQGGLLLASVQGPSLIQNQNYHQVVVLLLSHGPEGSKGVILNRPSGALVADLLGWGWQAESGSRLSLFTAFGDCRVFLGDFFAPNKIVRQPVTVLHGQADLARSSTEVTAGVYTGGELAAAESVLDGQMQQVEFRVFSGLMQWGPGQLALEANSGVWITAECSRSLVLKQCIGLPLPLWLEVLQLMGGEHGELAAQVIALRKSSAGDN